MGNSQMAIYRFPVKLKKILWRPSKCTLSSTQSVHYFNTKSKHNGERTMLSRCPDHCVMFFSKNEKGFQSLQRHIFHWACWQFMRTRRISPSHVWPRAQREVPAINLKLWQQRCPLTHWTTGLPFLTPPWCRSSVTHCSLIAGLQPWTRLCLYQFLKSETFIKLMKVCGSFSYKAKEHREFCLLVCIWQHGKKKSENVGMWGSFSKQDLHNSKTSVDTVNLLMNIDGNSNRTHGRGKHVTPLECYSDIRAVHNHCALVGDAS